MAFWPFNTDLTNLRITQENETGEKAKYLSLESHDKLTSNITVSTSSCAKRKQVKDNLTPYIVHSVSAALVIHVGYSEHHNKKKNNSLESRKKVTATYSFEVRLIQVWLYYNPRHKSMSE